MARRYYITYILTIFAGTAFFVAGIRGSLPDVNCLFLKATGHPCPSCGLTRSVAFAFAGDLRGSFAAHPFGIPVIIFVATAMTLSLYGLIARSMLENLFGNKLTTVATTAVIVYIAVWVIRLCV